MKCKIPEISWHNRDPVLSVDIQPKIQATTTINNLYRLASGGTDTHVLIWHLKLIERIAEDDGRHHSEHERYDSDTVLDLAADLTRHQRAVNCVKWSPNGELLASGDDDCVIFIWKQKIDNELSVNMVDETVEQDKEIWQTLKILRGHMEDVYDISWSPNSLHLVSASVDNSAIIWDVLKGKSLAILNDHKGFVQGVAWDPHNKYIATLSTDRYLRIFDIQTKKVLQRINKGCLPVDKSHPLYEKRMNLYHDDTLQTYFRRLTFTPDGKLLITPAGTTDCDAGIHQLHATYIYTRNNLTQPAILLPCPDQYTVAVSCCRLLYRLRPYNAKSNKPIIPLPYRMIFAVASRCSVYFYDTQQRPPFAVISNIHYTRLTDITWSDDGCIVIVSSTDGFCSLITFEPGELGELYDDDVDVSTSHISNVSIKQTEQLEESVQEQIDGSGEASDIDVVNVQTPEPKDFICGDYLKLNVENVPPEYRRGTPQEETPVKKTNKSISLHSTPILPTTILNCDKEILSSDRKFETPERKLPVTPINIRRQTRSPNASFAGPCNSITASASSSLRTLKRNTNSNKNQVISTEANRITQSADKITSPIIERKLTPIALILEEAARDAWPITGKIKCNTINYKPKSMESHVVDVDNTIKKKTNPIIIENDAGKSTMLQLNDTITQCNIPKRTGDIRLVNEESIIEDNILAINVGPSYNKQIFENKSAPNTKSIFTSPIKQQHDITKLQLPKQELQTKTPRRVAFRTISTPKYKDTL